MHSCSCCNHDKEELHIEGKKVKLFSSQNIIFAIGIVAFALSLIFQSNIFIVELLKFIACYVILGYQIIINCFKGLVKGQIFNENFLMLLASVGAFVLGDYFEGVAVVIFFTVGERFQDFAVNKSVQKIKQSLDFIPKTATLLSGETVPTETLQEGDELLVKAGERVPVDCDLKQNTACFNTSMINGESLPATISQGEQVLSGYIATDGSAVLSVKKTLKDSTATKIIDLVQSAAENKSKAENTITKFAKIYTPIVMLIAVILAVALPLIYNEPFLQHLKTALVFLVISCPCALVISVPLCFFYGIGQSAKIGALVKGGNYLAVLGKVDRMIFDKTGTLTEDEFQIVNVESLSDFSKEQVLEYITQLEFYSNHPIAKSVVKNAVKKDIGYDDVQEIAGQGISAKIGNNIYVASKDTRGVSQKTCVLLIVNNELKGYIELDCKIIEGTKEAISDLKKSGVKHMCILSGDKISVAQRVANELGIDTVYAEKSPQEKLSIVESMCDKRGKGTAYVGDGINDVLALSRADVGISTSKMQDAATVTADIVIPQGGIATLNKARKISQKTRKKVAINIIFSLAVKVAVMSLSIFFPVPLFVAILSDVGAALITVLISLI